MPKALKLKQFGGFIFTTCGAECYLSGLTARTKFILHFESKINSISVSLPDKGEWNRAGEMVIDSDEFISIAVHDYRVVMVGVTIIIVNGRNGYRFWRIYIDCCSWLSSCYGGSYYYNREREKWLSILTNLYRLLFMRIQMLWWKLLL